MLVRLPLVFLSLLLFAQLDVAAAQSGQHLEPAQVPKELVELLSSPITKILLSGTFIAIIIASGSLTYALLRYGKDIRKLSEFEMLSRLASLSRTMENYTSDYGRITLRLDKFSEELDDTKQRIATLMSKLNAVEDLVERNRPLAEPEPELPMPRSTGEPKLHDPEDVKRWEQIQSGWREVRDEIESTIELIDGRSRKKYGEAQRYNYSDILNHLRGDNVLSHNGFLDAQFMNRTYLRYRPRNAAVSLADADNFGALKSRVLADLKRFKRQRKLGRPASTSGDEPSDPSNDLSEMAPPDGGQRP